MITEDILWPCELADSIKNHLLGSAFLYSLDEGDHVVLGRGEANGLFYLLQGLVIVGIPALSKSSPFVVMKRGDWVGGTVIFKESDFLYRIASIEQSKIIFIPDNVIRDAINLYPELYKMLYLIIADHARESVGSLVASSGMKITQKVAYFLIEVAKHFPRVKGAKPMISLSQSMLAQMLGLSRLTLNQQLQLLVQKGLVAVERKAIHILDIAALAKLTNIEEINSSSRMQAKNIKRESLHLRNEVTHEWVLSPEIR